MKDFKELVGDFKSVTEEKVYKTIWKKFELMRKRKHVEY